LPNFVIFAGSRACDAILRLPSWPLASLPRSAAAVPAGLLDALRAGPRSSWPSRPPVPYDEATAW